jgi:hypothetical protein
MRSSARIGFHVRLSGWATASRRPADDAAFLRERRLAGAGGEGEQTHDGVGRHERDGDAGAIRVSRRFRQRKNLIPGLWNRGLDRREQVGPVGGDLTGGVDCKRPLMAVVDVTGVARADAVDRLAGEKRRVEVGIDRQ